MAEEAAAYPGQHRRLADFEALSFDCYGTLIDWEAGIAAVLGPWARSPGPRAGRAGAAGGVRGRRGPRRAGAPGRALPRHPGPELPCPGRAARRGGHRRGRRGAGGLGAGLARLPGLPGGAGRAEPPLPADHPVQRGPPVVRRQQRAAGRDLRAVVTAEDVGCYKPSQATSTPCWARWPGCGISGGKLLHVAQSLFHDHVPAKQAGLPTVWINRRHDRPGWGATPPPPAPSSPTGSSPPWRPSPPPWPPRCGPRPEHGQRDGHRAPGHRGKPGEFLRPIGDRRRGRGVRAPAPGGQSHPSHRSLNRDR